MKKRMNDKIEKFTEIYDKLFPLVYSIINKQVNNTEETRDLCQEIFTRLYEKFDEAENPRKWVLGTTRNVVFDFFKKKENKHVGIDYIMDDINLSFVNGMRDTRIMIEEALEDMGNFEEENDREIFELIAINNLTHKEVAKFLGINKWVVRYRYEQIQKKLTEYFKKKGIKSLEDLL
ncbi:MAG: sigma-70 family RNA polymerase sigma factor [bacterium]|nr:sigma-70 family RNA polymerase sigma factor [bacterium]